ncbi:TolC family protein [Fulvimonas yonginensis]|uniref:TolC family protein n=1 Tax=Fulvimonas yonginensis TaxID=1495200 RepID=A0ABU8JB93_9GAMM
MMSSRFAAWRAAAPGLAMALAWAMAAAAHAAQTPLTLDEAVRQGTARAPLLAASSADIDAAREEAMRAGRLPDPSLTAGVSNYPVTGPGAFGIASDPMTMRTLGVMQAIPSRASREAERGLADARIGAAEAQRTLTAQAVHQRVAEAWIALWAAQRKRDLLEELRGESVLAVTLTQARLRGGVGSAADALAARAEAAALDNRIAGVDAERAAARAGLQRWLGDPAPTLAEAPDFDRLPVSPDELEQDVDRQAPLQAWQAREQLAQAELDRARAAKHPDWSVSASYGQRALGRPDMVMLQVGVSLPLFTRNRQDRGISARQAQRDAVAFAHEDARRAQREAVARAIADWQGWGAQLARYRDTLLPLDHDRVSAALAAYRGGGGLQPWLDARRDQIEHRLAYADALAAHARAWAALAYLMPSEESAP